MFGWETLLLEPVWNLASWEGLGPRTAHTWVCTSCWAQELKAGRARRSQEQALGHQKGGVPWDSALDLSGLPAALAAGTGGALPFGESGPHALGGPVLCVPPALGPLTRLNSPLVGLTAFQAELLREEGSPWQGASGCWAGRPAEAVGSFADKGEASAGQEEGPAVDVGCSRGRTAGRCTRVGLSLLSWAVAL